MFYEYYIPFLKLQHLIALMLSQVYCYIILPHCLYVVMMMTILSSASIAIYELDTKSILTRV